jgi:hypothetical protein
LPAYVFKKIILCPHGQRFHTAFLAKISICAFHEKEITKTDFSVIGNENRF